MCEMRVSHTQCVKVESPACDFLHLVEAGDITKTANILFLSHVFT